MPVAVADKGLKRICPSCGNRYYDMNKRPVLCPGCGVEFTGELKVKARRGRVAAIEEEDDTNSPATAKEKDTSGDEEIEADEDTVSLDDVEKLEEGEEDPDLADATLDSDLDDLDADDEVVADDLEDDKE